MEDIQVKEWQGCYLVNPVTPEDVCWKSRGHTDNHHLMTHAQALTDEQQAEWERYEDESLIGLQQIIARGREMLDALERRDSGEQFAVGVQDPKQA